MGNYINSYIEDGKKIYNIEEKLNKDIIFEKIDRKISSNNEILKNKCKFILIHSKNDRNVNLKKEFIKQKNYCIISHINNDDV